jgi:Ice-binding-like
VKFRGLSVLLVVLILPLFASTVYADATLLGTAAPFAVLAGSAVSNTGTSVIAAGDLGVAPATAITGFPPGIVKAPGTTNDDNAVAQKAQTDLVTAYNTLAGMSVTKVLTGTDLGGLTLTPGVYFFANSAQLTGPLTLNAQGKSNAVWVFQIGTTLTTASGSVVSIENPGSRDALFWQIGTSATVGTGTDFEGNIVALTSITLNNGATDNCGRILARNGAVTLNNNTISLGCEDLRGEKDSGGLSGLSDLHPAPTPESGTLLLVGCGILVLLTLFKRVTKPFSFRAI